MGCLHNACTAVVLEMDLLLGLDGATQELLEERLTEVVGDLLGDLLPPFIGFQDGALGGGAGRGVGTPTMKAGRRVMR